MQLEHLINSQMGTAWVDANEIKTSEEVLRIDVLGETIACKPWFSLFIAPQQFMDCETIYLECKYKPKPLPQLILINFASPL